MASKPGIFSRLSSLVGKKGKTKKTNKANKENNREQLSLEQDYNPVLNFRVNESVKLPDWYVFPDDGVNIICGVGDYVDGNIPNVEKFKNYDIFVCLGDDFIPKGNDRIYTSVDENVQWLVENTQEQKTKLLCLLDLNDKEQVDRFINIFEGKVKLLNSYSNSPMFNPVESVSLLKKPGGIVVISDYISNIPINFHLVEKTKWRGFFTMIKNNNKRSGINKFFEIIDPETGFLNCIENGNWYEPITNEMKTASLVCERNEKDFEFQVNGGFRTKKKSKRSKKRIKKYSR